MTDQHPGSIVMWGQADRGGGFGFAHLFWRNAANQGAIDDGHQAVCGYDPTRHNGQARDVRFQPAGEDAVRCSKCERREAALVGRTWYPIGQHPADRKAPA